jgi:hypothetical protein
VNLNWYNKGMDRAIAFHTEDKKNAARADRFREANIRLVKKLSAWHSDYNSSYFA